MATLYVENLPDDRDQALRDRAKARRRFIAAEVLSPLQETIPTKKELERRQQASKKLRSIKLKRLPGEKFVPVVEMIREDGER